MFPLGQLLPPCRIPAILLAIGMFSAADSLAASYDIRALTGDKATSFFGGVRQGSFGSPALNDKGSVAYACILYGPKVNAITNTSIIYKPKSKKKKAATAVQAGAALNDSFLPGYGSSNVYGLPGSAYVYGLDKNVAINKRNQIAFIAEVISTTETDNYQNGVLVSISYAGDDRSDYGVVFPSASGPGGFQNANLAIYDSYFPEILQRTLSINSQGSVPRNSDIQVTPTRTVPGFRYSYATSLIMANLPSNGGFVTVPYYLSSGAILATTESNVIGLPYETTYQSFSDAIIANKNRIFLVADISDTGDEYDGLWQGNNPNLQPVVVKQTKAPGGGVFESFEGTAGPNPTGKLVAFIANLGGAGADQGVFVSNLKGTQIDQLALTGDDAPGTEGTFSAFELASVNDRGAVAILGTIKDGSSTRTGVWVSDRSRKTLELIVLTGDTLNVRGKEKRITRIACSPVGGFNRKSEIAFTASFNDKTSAVIVAKP